MKQLLLIPFLFAVGHFSLGAQNQKSERIEMVRVEGGTFMMCESVLTTVSGYSIGKFEVTQAQWKAVMGTNPSFFKGERLPVEQVNWYDAVEFCNALSKKEGLKTAYIIDKKSQDLSNTSQYDMQKWLVTLNSDSNGYRLPTEAQWEFAARGGVLARGTSYSGSGNVDDVAWFVDTSMPPRTKRVGTKSPNELGVFDMSGNVWEWVQDWYDVSLTGGTDPKGPPEGSDRVIRGGSWCDLASCATVTNRLISYPSWKENTCGFRVVRP